MTSQGALSPMGRCKTFDKDADGYARGEAINAILIKPLEDAIRDGDPIRAVIRSTAINADGKTQGIVCPSVKSHEMMIRAAYNAVGIENIGDTPYIECHGTGTAIGDPLETTAIANAFGSSHVKYIGSVRITFGYGVSGSSLTDSQADKAELWSFRGSLWYYECCESYNGS